MKLLLAPALAAALLALASSLVRATPLDDRIAELKHAVEKEAAARVNGPNPAMSPVVMNASLDQWVSQMENPTNGGTMDGQLAQLTSVYTSTEVQEAATNLLAEIHKERKDKADADKAKLKALVEQAAQQVTAAKKAEDLDAVIAELQASQSNLYANGVSPQDQELSRRAASVLEFAKQWQNYLVHSASGQAEEAMQDLRSLSGFNGEAALIPRSKLLELQTPGSPTITGAPGPPSVLDKVHAALASIKTLDDLEPALAKIEPLQYTNITDSNTAVTFGTAQSDLMQLVQAYHSLKAGLPAYVSFDPGFASEIPADVRAQLWNLALRCHLDTFKGPPPSPSEKPLDFVGRVMADAISREDWTLLRRGLEAKSHLVQDAGARYFAYSPEAPDDLIAGSNQEAAGQFALAVISYENALRLDDSGIPAKLIGDKLAAIQRNHPKEFAEGMQTLLSSPAPKRSLTPLPNLFRAADSNTPGNINFPAGAKPAAGASSNVSTNAPAAAH